MVSYKFPREPHPLTAGEYANYRTKVNEICNAYGINVIFSPDAKQLVVGSGVPDVFGSTRKAMWDHKSRVHNIGLAYASKDEVELIRLEKIEHRLSAYVYAIIEQIEERKNESNNNRG